MRQFFLVANLEKENTETMAKQIRAYLKERGAVCTLCPQVRQSDGLAYKYTDARLVPEGTEAVLVLGGDGTLIQAARDLAVKNLPLLGINMGTLGYLTQGGPEEVWEMLDALLANHFWIEERMLLSGTAKNRTEIALNDIVLARGGSLRMLRFQIFVNGEMLSEYKADGMIVATPTGSTAYNLSAGGPIVDPRADLILLTPICAHTLNTRSIVLSAADTVQIVMQGREQEKQAAIFDGDTEIVLNAGDCIEIKKAESTVQMLKLRRTSFVERLREKMASQTT
ncbi:MAG: NAD(+)/NADH kinase [bacterium]|nr:NAD(+)/NADH kinase [bacterium]